MKKPIWSNASTTEPQIAKRSDRIQVEQRRSPEHQGAHVLQEREIGPLACRRLDAVMKQEQLGDGQGHQIAEEETIDRLADR